MARRQRDNLIASAGEEDIAVDEERSGPLASKDREHVLEIAFSNRPRNENLHPHRARRVLHGSFWMHPARHAHYGWTGNEEEIMQIQFIGQGGIDYVNPPDDPRQK